MGLVAGSGVPAVHGVTVVGTAPGIHHGQDGRDSGGKGNGMPMVLKVETLLCQSFGKWDQQQDP